MINVINSININRFEQKPVQARKMDLCTKIDSFERKDTKNLSFTGMSEPQVIATALDFGEKIAAEILRTQRPVTAQFLENLTRFRCPGVKFLTSDEELRNSFEELMKDKKLTPPKAMAIRKSYLENENLTFKNKEIAVYPIKSMDYDNLCDYIEQLTHEISHAVNTPNFNIRIDDLPLEELELKNFNILFKHLERALKTSSRNTEQIGPSFVPIKEATKKQLYQIMNIADENERNEHFKRTLFNVIKTVTGASSVKKSTMKFYLRLMREHAKDERIAYTASNEMRKKMIGIKEPVEGDLVPLFYNEISDFAQKFEDNLNK